MFPLAGQPLGQDEGFSRIDRHLFAVRDDHGDRTFEQHHELIDLIGLELARHRRAVPNARHIARRFLLVVDVTALHGLAGFQARRIDGIPCLKAALGGAMGLKARDDWRCYDVVSSPVSTAAYCARGGRDETVAKS